MEFKDDRPGAKGGISIQPTIRFIPKISLSLQDTRKMAAATRKKNHVHGKISEETVPVTSIVTPPKELGRLEKSDARGA